ncbi:UDP-N-acetylmuramate--L-alanine ligase [Candidatus Peregrinibacteria bacterium]|nr:UDP-N-acetylmuramate--L-alanine ligase [Candidatus Peregrinibacteria bacterium]
MLNSLHHIHFIGIGGSGISAIAYLALEKGIKVTGSDIAGSPITEDLAEHGARFYVGHAGEHVPDTAELVVYSEAIDQKTNPEFLAAKKKGIPVMSYFESISEISKHKKTIAVAGTHGKTTTTAMLGEALVAAGLDPTVIVGSRVPEFGGKNIRVGHGELFVVESCEYRRSFLNLNPFGAVLLNCEPDHLDYYKDEKDYVSAFIEFIKKVPKDGFIIANMLDKNVQKVCGYCVGNVVGLDSKKMAEISLNMSVPGDFNKSNATHAYLAALQVGAAEKPARKGLENFKGTARRMEVIGEKDGVTVIDDYGHHPTEIKATLLALRDKYKGRRIICVFQPHQYSRTYRLLGDFKTAFGDADKVLIPNIYEARDTAEDKKRISAVSFVAALREHHPDVTWTKDFKTTVGLLYKENKPGDVIVTMGAGDGYKVGEMFLGHQASLDS